MVVRSSRLMEVLSTCNFHGSLGDHLVHQEGAAEGFYDIIALHIHWSELCHTVSPNGLPSLTRQCSHRPADRLSTIFVRFFCEHSLSLSIAATQFLIITPFPRHTRIVALLVLRRFCGAGFINFLTYFLAAGAISLGIGFLALSSALWFLICKRRELFRSPNIKSIDEKLKQRLYKRKAKPQSVFISRNFHTGQPQPQVEHREREAAQMKALLNFSKDELCLPDLVDRESPDMLSVENSNSVTVSLSTSVPSSYCSLSVEAADEWFSNDSLEAKTPPEPLLGEPLAEKVLAYLSSISVEEWPRNTMNMTFCGIQKDENTKKMFSQRNTEAGIHNLPCDTE
ncbi:uncharacterized protein C1orf185 homolog [Microtus pennsylvanicus]|uniref:uncharacterized protein C1orf185 homolog n=1 Tax=Microtus pennsylvanicus TaxID=10058 RepID=UPI003F6BADF3